MNYDITNKLLGYFSLFLFIFLTCSFVVTNKIISSVSIAAFWSFNLFCLLRWNSKFDKRIFGILCLIVGITFFSAIYNNESIVRCFKLMFAYAIALLYVQRNTLSRFVNHYINIMFYLSLFSIICYSLYNIFPILNSVNPVINNAGHSYSNLYLFCNTLCHNRNNGMFWEPGAFQAFINLALLFEVLKKQFKTTKIIVFVVAILTTFSTTGYIALFFSLAVIAYKNKFKHICFFMIAALLVLLSIILLKPGFVSDWLSPIFNKIIYLNTESNNITSASVRYYAMRNAFIECVKHPFWGVGVEGLKCKLYDYTLGMNTCTFANWYGVYGVLYGLVMTYGYCLYVKKLVNDRNLMLWVSIIISISIISEDFSDNAFFLLIALYGYKKDEAYFYC